MSDKFQTLPVLPCACASLRRAARALSQRYEEALRPAGLTITQFTILQALTLAGEITQGMLGEILVMDSTTLTRTLRIMLREGWVAERRGKDRRERLISLSSAGRQLFEAASAPWEKAQEDLRKELGDARWRGLFEITNQFTALVKEGGKRHEGSAI
jgi:DNA-binding MarR family transcriptional regulator